MKLEDYSKEVLVAYIKDRHLWSGKELEEIKNDLEFKKLMKQSEDIRNKMSKCKGIERISEYVKLMDKDRVIHKKIDKLLKLDNDEVS